MADQPMTPLPSATVVLVRGGGSELETLLLQRAGREGQPGPWVFPGGRVEPHDVVGGDESSVATARLAATRETQEESGLHLAADTLGLLSRWVTPEVSPKRFDTWFFIAEHDEAQSVQVDGEEMVDHRWIGAREALDADWIRLAPPQFVTLTWLLDFPHARAAAIELPERDFVTFRPRICRTDTGAVMLYTGDAGYESADPNLPGARHRCVTDATWRYRYERTS